MPAGRRVEETAARVARSRGAALHLVHVRETRAIGEESVDLEDRGSACAVVDAAVSRAGLPDVTGEVLHVTGHHEDAADAVLELAERTAPTAIIVGRPAAHGDEPGAPSLTTSSPSGLPATSSSWPRGPARPHEPVAA